MLEAMVSEDSRELDYLRSRRSCQLLAMELARLRYRHRRARPTPCPRDPRKAGLLGAIEAALAENGPYTEGFYVDEADVDLNTRIGSSWMRCGERTTVPTPVRNQKHYLAGALCAHTDRLVWVECHRKTSALFLTLLEQIRHQYRRAKHIVLILDNYGIHKSRVTGRWFAQDPRFQLLFQPTYPPRVNVNERLWKAMHDTVTPNHRCRSMYEPCKSVARILTVVRPFPGNGHGVAHLESAT